MVGNPVYICMVGNPVYICMVGNPDPVCEAKGLSCMRVVFNGKVFKVGSFEISVTVSLFTFSR